MQYYKYSSTTLVYLKKVSLISVKLTGAALLPRVIDKFGRFEVLMHTAKLNTTMNTILRNDEHKCAIGHLLCQ